MSRKFVPGLRVPAVPLTPPRMMSAPPHWTPPEYIDGRPYLLPADDQGATSQCVGFGISGICEGFAWWATGVKSSLPASMLYDKAKELDGDSRPGTSLEQGLKAAELLGWLTVTTPEGVKLTLVPYDVESPAQIKYAFHRFPAILFGFNITDAWNSPDSWGNIRDSNVRVGGHCSIGSGYDELGLPICNSWGLSYGDNGYLRLTWKQAAEQLLGAKGFIIENTTCKQGA